MNNLDYDHIPVPIERDSATIVAKSEAQIRAIGDRVLLRRRGRNHLARSVVNALLWPMYAAMRPAVIRSLREYAYEESDRKLTFRELMPLTDRSILVDDRCDGCGTCARACPAQNISIVDGRPRYGGRCEICFACDEWCPRGAVHHWSRADGVKYHHPDVTLRDMIGRSG
jgi:formate hydrogenlyase subunit 6/NADH:ubiquinone oxidoreductase subunit I